MSDEALSRRSLGRKTKRSASEEYYLSKTGGLPGGSSRDMGELYDDDDHGDEERDDHAQIRTTEASSSSLPSFAPQEPMLPCEFCTELVKLSDFEGHQLECGRVRGALRPAQIALAAARAQALAAAANMAVAGGGGTGRGPGGQQRAAQGGPGAAAVAASASATTAANASLTHPVMGGPGLYRQHQHHPNPGGNATTNAGEGGGGPHGGGGLRRNNGRLHATIPARNGVASSDRPIPSPHALVGPGTEMETETTLMGEEDEDVEVIPSTGGVDREHGDGHDQPLRGVMQAILGALTATTANTARMNETTNGTTLDESATAGAHRQPLHQRRLIHHHHHQAELARSYQQQRMTPLHTDQQGPRGDDNMPPLIPIDDDDDASPPDLHENFANNDHAIPAGAAVGGGDFGYPFQGINTLIHLSYNTHSNPLMYP